MAFVFKQTAVLVVRINNNDDLAGLTVCISIVFFRFCSGHKNNAFF